MNLFRLSITSTVDNSINSDPRLFQPEMPGIVSMRYATDSSWNTEESVTLHSVNSPTIHPDQDFPKDNSATIKSQQSIKSMSSNSFGPNFEKLPPEVISSIADKLSYGDARTFALTSRYIKDLVDNSRSHQSWRSDIISRKFNQLLCNTTLLNEDTLIRLAHVMNYSTNAMDNHISNVWHQSPWTSMKVMRGTHITDFCDKHPAIQAAIGMDGDSSTPFILLRIKLCSIYDWHLFFGGSSIDRVFDNYQFVLVTHFYQRTENTEATLFVYSDVHPTAVLKEIYPIDIHLKHKTTLFKFIEQMIVNKRSKLIMMNWCSAENKRILNIKRLIFKFCEMLNANRIEVFVFSALVLLVLFLCLVTFN